MRGCTLCRCQCVFYRCSCTSHTCEDVDDCQRLLTPTAFSLWKNSISIRVIFCHCKPSVVFLLKRLSFLSLGIFFEALCPWFCFGGGLVVFQYIYPFFYHFDYSLLSFQFQTPGQPSSNSVSVCLVHATSVTFFLQIITAELHAFLQEQL